MTLKKVEKGIIDKVTFQRIGGGGGDRGNGKCKGPEAGSYLAWSRNSKEAGVARAEYAQGSSRRWDQGGHGRPDCIRFSSLW